MPNPFTEHPREVGMSYWQHARFALSFTFWMIAGVFASVIHALLPFLFTTTTSDIIKKLHAKIADR
ncbi:MAG: DUF6356 family protein [Candidatus Kapaibacterium sp.]